MCYSRCSQYQGSVAQFKYEPFARQDEYSPLAAFYSTPPEEPESGSKARYPPPGNEMLALRSASHDVDNERFKSVMTLSEDDKSTERRSDSSPEGEEGAPSFRTLQLRRLRGCPRLTSEGILALVDYCRCLRELLLPYSALNDDLLMALSAEKLQLETLRLEAHPETKPLPRISERSWSTFANHFPDINLILSSFVGEESDYDALLASYIPLTHLYFGESPSEATISRLGRHCPRLVELVIGTCGPGLLDESLIAVGRGCPRLSALGLADCEISCTAFVEFVTLCAQRLRLLYVWETSLIEDSKFDIAKTSATVSTLLGRTWVPEFIPVW